MTIPIKVVVKFSPYLLPNPKAGVDMVLDILLVNAILF